MACVASTISYISPEGITTLYTPAAQQQMGTESPTPAQISSGTPTGTIMQSPPLPPAPPPGPVVGCDGLTESTPDSISLSPNFTLAQCSYLAPGNDAPYHVVDQLGLTRPQIICNLIQVCNQIAEPTLAYITTLGHPRLTISSGFRIPKPTADPGSNHYRGAALDLQVLDMTPQQLFALAQWIATNLPCDQIIMEGVGSSQPWIHTAMTLTGTSAPASRLLTQTGTNTYAQGLYLLNYGAS